MTGRRASVVRSRRFENVVVLEMNRPERRNAMDTRLLEALLEALRSAGADSSVGGVVLTGAGGAFSSGADVSEKAVGAAAVRRMNLFCDLYETVTAFPKPSVAAIAGPCVGGGAETAAACDLRVGSPSASIRFPGAVFGIPVGTARLPLLVGLSHAKDLLMTSRTVGAEEAYRIGFLNRVVSESDLEHEAVAMAAAMAANPGAVLQKRLLDESSRLSHRVETENRHLNRWQAEAIETQTGRDGEKAPGA